MRSGRKRSSAAAIALAATAVIAAACSSTSSSPTTTSGGSTPTGSDIKIALITSETGIAASQFQTSPQGFLARIAEQNAKGGVNGHKLVGMVYDDQGSLTTVATATKQAMADGAVGIVSDTPFFFGAYKYPQQAGIPVTGGSFDGFEWGTQPNTNMFASDTGSVNPDAPYSASTGAFLKSHGGTTVGSYGYGISPSSAYSANATAKSAKLAGLKIGVLDTTIGFGSVDFTTAALAAKSAGVDTLYGAMDNNSNFAAETALKQAGVKLKVVTFPTGYEPDIIGTPAWQAVQGAYFSTAFRPFSIPSSGTVEMAAALQKYEKRAPADFPTFNIYESWLGADLMIKGLEMAGTTPTPAKVITELRSITSYDGGGIDAVPINFTTVFGKGNPTQCTWYMQAQTNGFVAASKTPTCGVYIPGSTSKTAP